MKKILIYDPAMCCSTGVCGASVDKELLRVATVIENLKQQGADISRFNLASQPEDFIKNQAVQSRLQQDGPEVLPITIVDGEIVKTKEYPANEEFTLWTGLVIKSQKEHGNCCCKGGCC
ncbi:hypothetical protein P22_2657 [Propionispora sp. 2/2-37]|uniref:arsenite efflux transporter metallochaperone ArsD n=1 Tax=Propionispora sp. 2/2-37 TaxID=1677858 RepID=UPI0006BB5E65|nr:arsenite efflux transporter metallochaperone ArsD [Propionispora sp. 2/2-37]CUH96567.1 hypothetical protein P22_2657 [Propionispora sp. 2/2-37]